MRCTVRVAILGLAVGPGCAVKQVAPQTLLDAAGTDPIAAMAQWEDDVIQVTSRVLEKRLVPRRQVETLAIHRGSFTEARAVTTTEQIPVLVLEPAGRIHAYFEPSATERLASVQLGETVTLTCYVDQVLAPPEGPFVSLSCSIGRR